MKSVCIYVFREILRFIYFFLKLFPTNNNKIVFISRQSNDINIDFSMIRDEINKRDSSIKMVFLTKRISEGVFAKVLYVFTIFRQMYHLATSKVCVLDSYCIPVCVLKHKKSLFVLQLWHSIGKIKKSGYQTLGTVSGRNEKIAKIMCMHKNYDKIIAGGVSFDKFYEEGFNVKRDALLHFGLPRIDYSLENEERFRKEILKKYPEFKGKKIVYYVPTFRTYDAWGPKLMIDKYNKKDFILIARAHPNQPLKFNHKKVYECPGFKNIELLSVADYVITDYSSICLEAAVLNKKVLFYVYDYDKYMESNGINLDPFKVMPTCTSKNIEDLFKIINDDSYDIQAFKKFRKNYLPKKLGKSTVLITDCIMEHLNKQEDI